MIWAPSALVAFAVIEDVAPDLTVVGLAEQVTDGGVNGFTVKLVEQLAELFFFHLGSVIVALAV